MFRGDENTWLNKITSCVLTNMDVNYANGNYQTFRPVWGAGNEGAPPTEIEMKLDNNADLTYRYYYDGTWTSWVSDYTWDVRFSTPGEKEIIVITRDERIKESEELQI